MPPTLDQQQLESALRACRARSLSFALLLTGNRDDAEDIVQEASLRVLRSSTYVDGYDTERFWFYQQAVLRQVWCREMRNRIRSPTVSMITCALMESDEPEPGEALYKEADTAEIRRLITLLPERQQMAVVAHFFDNLPVSRIAVRCGVSETAIRNRLNASYNRLRKMLADNNA